MSATFIKNRNNRCDHLARRETAYVLYICNKTHTHTQSRAENSLFLLISGSGRLRQRHCYVGVAHTQLVDVCFINTLAFESCISWSTSKALKITWNDNLKVHKSVMQAIFIVCVFVIKRQGFHLGFYCRNERCMQRCVKKYTRRIKLCYVLYC